MISKDVEEAYEILIYYLHKSLYYCDIGCDCLYIIKSAKWFKECCSPAYIPFSIKGIKIYLCEDDSW